MDDHDKTPVLADGDTDRGRTHFTCKSFMVFPALLGYFVTLGMGYNLITEYIHDRIDKDYAANERDELQKNYTYDPCHSNKSGPGYARYTHVQQETAKWQNYYSCARVIPAIFSILISASFSDVIGRKILIVLCISGYLGKQLVISLVIHFQAHIAFLIIGEVLDGCVGTYIGFLAVLFAVIADITETGRTRTIAIVLLELLLGITVSISTFGTGYYIKYAGFFYPAVTGFGCVFASLFLTVLFLPETLRGKKTGGFKSLISSLSTAFKLYFRPESKLKQIKYFLLITAFIFYTIQLLNRGNIETLYQLGEPFCWSSTKIGWFGAARMSLTSLLGMGGIFVMKKALANDTIAVLGSALTVVSYVVEGLAKTETVLYTVPVLATLSIMPISMIRSLMSELTPAEKQGAMFSTLGAFETLCSLIGALTGNLVYSATLSIMNGFVFFVLAVVTAICGAILGAYMCVQRCHPDKSEDDIKEIRVNHQEK